jgi:hypothetical protein
MEAQDIQKMTAEQMKAALAELFNWSESSSDFLSLNDGYAHGYRDGIKQSKSIIYAIICDHFNKQ